MAMKTHNNDTVVGVFLDQSQAQRAMQALKQTGYNAQIADESAISAFRNIGWENDVVDVYRNRYNEGNSVVVANGTGSGRGEDALGIMLQNGAEYINLSGDGTGTQNRGYQTTTNTTNTTNTTSTTNATNTTDQTRNAGYYSNLDRNRREYGQVDTNLGRRRNANEINVQLREETVTPVKQAVQTGEVGVRKTVREQQQEVPVNLRRDEVVVERRAVDRPANANEIGDMGENTMSVPVYEERAEMQKQAHVYEEVNVRKQPVEEQQKVSATTRREEIDLTQNGDVNMQGNVGRTAGSWTQAMPAYRTKWEQSHRGQRWEDAEPAYKYAYEMQSNPKYKGRSYSEVEGDLRSDWQRRGGPTAWDKISANVRDAWNNITN